jgi:hypothetical protein
VFVGLRRRASLRQAGRPRTQCIEVLTRAKPQGSLYKAVERIVELVTVRPRSGPSGSTG